MATTEVETNKAQFRRTYEEMFHQGNLAVADELIAPDRVTLSGTHLGPFIGIAPTGRSVRQAQVHFVRFRDGKGVEHRAVRDDLGLMQQLGVIPAPAHEYVPEG